MRMDDGDYAAWQAERDLDRAYDAMEGADRERQGLHAEIDYLSRENEKLREALHLLELHHAMYCKWTPKAECPAGIRARALLEPA